MSYINLINSLGFIIDPFAKTNADEEEHLERYFIEPPFYNAVYGDINNPKSTVVFAPRGGGKTALKRKIEITSQDDSFMCLSYNSFNVVGLQIGDISLEYHLNNIIRLILVGVLSCVQSVGLEKFTRDDRHLIYLFIKKYLSEIDKTELKEAIYSVKQLKDKAKDWWNAFTGPIGIVINALFAKMGFEKVELEKFNNERGVLGSLSDQLTTLYNIAYKAGNKSIYILIDKVDENNLTGNSASYSYNFIEPLITSLQILELRGFAFKFFLWDAIKEEYQKDARPDRVKYHNLLWEKEQLNLMLSRRLKAFSQNKVTSFTQVCDISNGTSTFL